MEDEVRGLNKQQQQGKSQYNKGHSHKRRWTGSSIPPNLNHINPPLSGYPLTTPIVVPTVQFPLTNGTEPLHPFYTALQPQHWIPNTVIRHSSKERKPQKSSDVEASRTNIATHMLSQNGLVVPKTISPRHSIPSMQAKKVLNAQTQVDRPMLRSSGSNHSISTSLPATPRQTRISNNKSRSPSPPSYSLDSPRSANSDPVSSNQPTLRRITRGCKFETLLVHSRRRMPYSIGAEWLGKESPEKDVLLPEDEEHLTKQVEQLYQNLLPSDESNERRRKFVEKLEKLLNDEWPGHDIKARPFGSTENKLCTSDSDVDICITTTNKDLENVCLLAAAFAKHGMERIVCVQSAKVPIVKIWDPEFKVSCDMNVNNTLALSNTRMMKTYVEIDPRVRPLAMIIKHWTKQRILNDAAGGGTISSYTWICIIINFLQTRHPPILPALHQRDHKKLPLVDGLDVSFDDDLEALKDFGAMNTESLGTLLFAFFKRLGYEMDYENKVISVRHGKLLSKTDKRFNLLQNNRLCVEEPFNVNRSLSNSADDTTVRGLHLEFRRAFELLSESPPNWSTACEGYVYPKEESYSNLFVKPSQSRPVNLTRSHSNSSRQSRGSNYNGNGNRAHGGQRGGFSSRRSSNGATTGNPLHPHPLYSQQSALEPCWIMRNADGTLSIAALNSNQKPGQITADHLRQAQFARYFQQQTQSTSTHANGNPVGPDQGQSPSKGQDLPSDLPNPLLFQQQPYNPTNPASQMTWPYSHYTQNPYYPSPGMMDTANSVYGSVMSPSLDARSAASRSGRNTGGTGGVRSKSQPAPHVDYSSRGGFDPALSLTEVQNQAIASHVTLQNLQSHQQLHKDEYIGYFYHDKLEASPDFGITSDQRKWSSREKSVPKISSYKPPSPTPVSAHPVYSGVLDAAWISSSEGDGERSVSQDSFDEEPRRPLIVNGSGDPATSPQGESVFVQASYDESPQSDPYQVYADSLVQQSDFDLMKQNHEFYVSNIPGNEKNKQAMAVPGLANHNMSQMILNGYVNPAVPRIHPGAYPYQNESRHYYEQGNKNRSPSRQPEIPEQFESPTKGKSGIMNAKEPPKVKMEALSNATAHLTMNSTRSNDHTINKSRLPSTNGTSQNTVSPTKRTGNMEGLAHSSNAFTHNSSLNGPTVVKAAPFIKVKSKKAKKKKSHAANLGGQPLVGEERKGG